MTAQLAETIGLAFIPAFLILDLIVRHRRFETAPFWRARALAVSAAMVLWSIAVTLAWGTLLEDRSLLDTRSLGALGGAFLVFNAMFQHANLRTPRWLGYLIQRPESHSLHHARGVHAFNYSDLPLWDMIFGTFRNPERMQEEVGFYTGASTRVPAMLIGRDVSVPPPGRQSVLDAAPSVPPTRAA